MECFVSYELFLLSKWLLPWVYCVTIFAWAFGLFYPGTCLFYLSFLDSFLGLCSICYYSLSLNWIQIILVFFKYFWCLLVKIINLLYVWYEMITSCYATDFYLFHIQGVHFCEYIFGVLLNIVFIFESLLI